MRAHHELLFSSLILLVVTITACGGPTAVPQTSLPATATPIPSPSATAESPTLPPPTDTALPATVSPTSPPPTATPEPPTSTPASELPPTRIEFASGATSALVEGIVSPGEANRYVLRASAGQTMRVYLSPYQPEQLLMAIWGADGDVLMSGHVEATQWTGKLRSTQDYYISVTTADGGAAVSYALQVVIPVRIQFAAGATSALTRGGTPPAGTDSYVLGVMAGQIMTVRLEAAHGLGLIVIWGEDGTVLISDHAEATEWSGSLPSTQDYYIDVRSAADSPLIDYALDVIIPARIQFAPGAISALVSGSTPPAGTVNYVLGAAAGQTMTVRLTVTQGLGLVVIWGADGVVLISDHAEATEWTGVLPSTQDYHIDVRSAADGPSLLYTLEVIIPPLP